jgi:3-phosphoshikimate 1-carboxyvinyltransferase
VKTKISKISDNISGEIRISGSKSISNRMLIIRGLSDENCNIENLSTSDDTIRLLDLQAGISSCEKSGIPMVLDINNAGTVARFLTAYLAAREGLWLITGQGRMLVRPMEGIVDCLRQVGADIEYTREEGHLPIKIRGKDIRGNTVSIDASKSSQFLSAIMMIGPYFENGLNITLEKKPVSMPYVEMTAKLMQMFGAHVEIASSNVQILKGKYQFHRSTVEPDWSSASYYYELLALADNGEIKLEGFTKNSLQGDSIIPEVFKDLGIDTIYENDGILIRKSNNITEKFSFDFSGNPDITPSVIVTCAALGIDSEFKNVSHLQYKESNRIDALKKELAKIGAKLTLKENNIILKQTQKVKGDIVFDSYDDHRMAMAFAPLVMKYNNITINHSEVVNKSYREFWDDIKKLNFATLMNIDE